MALVLAARTHEPEGTRPLEAIGVVCLALWASYWVHGETASHLIERGEVWTSPTQALRNYTQAFHRDDQITSVISGDVPWAPTPNLSAALPLYQPFPLLTTHP